jgi:hypothetical protein
MKIQFVITLMLILDREESVKEKLLLKFNLVDENSKDFEQAVPRISHQEHPILHKFISRKSG